MVGSKQRCDVDRGREFRERRRRPEGVAIALHDQGRDAGALKFGYPRGFWAPRWVQREGEG